MKDATVAVEAAIRSALVSALTTGGYSTPTLRVLVNPRPDDTLPYIVIAGETGVPFRTKTSEGMEVTVSMTAWDDQPTDAKTLADVAIQALTSRTSPLAVTGYVTVIGELDFRDAPVYEGNPPEEYWGIPFRVRYRLVET